MAIRKINSRSLIDDAIATADIADGSISTAKLANDAVTSAKLDNTISLERLDVQETGTQFDPNDSDGTATVFLKNGGGTQGIGAYGSALVLSKVDSTQPMAAISSTQSRTDYPAYGGLSFFTHQSVSDNDDLEEVRRTWADGRITEQRGGIYWKSNLTGGSSFSNPDITMFEVTANGASYAQTCFLCEVYGHGVSANKTQYHKVLGTVNFVSDTNDSAPSSVTVTHVSNSDVGGGAVAPTFSVSGNAVRVTPDRQTNYDNYYIEVTVWGRAFKFGTDYNFHDINLP